MIRLTSLLATSLLLFVSWSSNTGYAASTAPPAALMCSTTVMAEASAENACQVGEQVTLNAIISGDYQRVQWSPTAGVSDPTAPTTNAIITSTTTYEVTVTSLSDQNLLNNGNFNLGFLNFTSDYALGTGGPFGILSNEATYVIAADASLTHANFASCTDHTGGGNMLVVNGASVADQNVVCQTVNVVPNTNYGFSAWITSVIPTAPAQLQLSIDGSLVGNIFTASSNTCEWNQFYEEWNSGAATTVELCLVNQNTDGPGNDFAVDDLFLAELCESTDAVTVNLADLTANWFISDDLCIFSDPVQLNALLAANATPGGSWTVNGTATDILDPTIVGAGDHQVTYSVMADPCTESVTHTITVLPEPSAAWLPPTNLCTASGSFFPDAMLLPGATPGGVWTVNGQEILVFDPETIGFGSHFVEYTVGSPPCRATRGQTVEVNFIPSAEWAPPSLVCIADGPFPMNDLLINDGIPGGTWTVNGTEVTNFNPSFWGIGNHQVIYTIGSAPCGETRSGTLVVSPPLPSPAPACSDITENSLEFQWDMVPNATDYLVEVLTGQSGTLVGSTFILNDLNLDEEVQIQVIAIGADFCNSAPSIIASCSTLDCIPPTVTIAAAGPICLDNAAPIDLQATVSDPTGNGTWSGPGIVNPSNGTFDPTLAGAGSHRIFYEYAINSCTSTDSVDIEVNNPPTAAFTTTPIVCENELSVLTFTGTAALGANFNWNVAPGIIVNGSGPGPVSVSWPTDGDYTIELTVDDGLCPVATSSQSITVQPYEELANVYCNTTSSSIEFFWSNPDRFTDYAVEVLTGQAGAFTSDSTFFLNGLTLGETVDIELIGLSGTACPNDTITVGCQALDCPTIILDITGPEVICFGTDGNIVNLVISVDGEDGSGSGAWSGPGITNTDNGTFSAITSGFGTHTIAYTYEQDGCTFVAEHEISVVLKPIAPFMIDESPICLSNTTTFSYLGIPPTNGDFQWDLDGGEIVSGASPGPIEVRWSEPGTKLVSLTVEEMGCASDPFLQAMIVDALIDTPFVMCQTTEDTLHYAWTPLPNASAYILYVIDGPNGFITSDSSYAIANLQPGQTINVQMETVSSNTCPGNEVVVGCTVSYCPGVEVYLESMPPICLADGQPDTLTLNYAIEDPDMDMATIRWRGAGIYDPTIGNIRVDPSMSSQPAWVYLDYTSGLCELTDSILVEVLPLPTASLSVPATICASDTATVALNGDATAGSTYIWDFAAAEIIDGDEAGPYQLYWDTPGSKSIAVTVQDSLCGQATAMIALDVAPLLVPPTINCQSSLSELLFTWHEVTGSNGFTAEVISGPSGVLTSDTSYLITGLEPGTSATLEVTFLSASLCPDITVNASCVASGCPEVSVNINPIAAICLADGMADTLELAATVVDTSGNTGTLTWSGPGIIDSENGWLELTGNGQSQQAFVYATYSLGACTYVDSTAYTVNPSPVADFFFPATVCAGDTAILSYTGPATTDDFNWTLSGMPTTIDSTGSLLQVVYASPGSYDISLTTQTNGCTTTSPTQTITIAAPLPTPVIACDAGLDQVVFSWSVPVAVTDVTVNVLDGPIGTLQGNDTYLITGLSPDQSVSIEVIFSGAGVCADQSAQAQCSTTLCPDTEVTLQQPDPVCFTVAGEQILLDVSVSGDTTGSTVAWSGAGITDPAMGVVTITPDMIGEDNWIYFQLSNPSCTFVDSTLLLVGETPVADFNLASQICSNETTSIVFTGTGPVGSTYIWDFADGNATPGVGAGPHEVSWSDPGQYQVSLVIAFGDCMSDTVFQIIDVLAPLPDPVISCTSDHNTISVSWPPAPGNAGYDLVLPDTVAGQFTSDTSLVISGLAPGTPVTMTLTYLDSLACRNSSITETCTTFICPDVALDLSGNDVICAGDSTTIQLEVTASEMVLLDITYQFQGVETTLTGVSGSQNITISPSSSGVFSLVNVTNSTHPACPIALPADLPITVHQPLSAGTVTDEVTLCSGLDTLISLTDLLVGQSPGGIWLETSTVPSTNNAFDATAATFRPALAEAGDYLFSYTVSSAAPCPTDTATLQVALMSTPTVVAGEDISLDCQFNMASIGSSLTTAGMQYQWTSNNGGALTDPAAAITEVSQPGVYTLTAVDPTTGCSASDQVEITSAVSFLLPYASTQDISCYTAGDGAIRIDSVVGGVAPVLVSMNGGPYGTETYFGSLAAGEYELQFRDAQDCKATLLLQVVEPDELQLNINTGLEADNNQMQLGDSILLQVETNIPFSQIDTLLWTPDTLGQVDKMEVMAAPTFTSTYTVQLIDQNGCTATDQVTLFVARERDVYIPNVFTPNNDGENDLFMIFAGQEVKQIKQFHIFNRWGEMVFTDEGFLPNDPKHGWDGMKQGRMVNAGVFVFAAEVEMIDGEVVIYKGDVTLLR